MITGSDPTGRAAWVQPLWWMIAALGGTVGAGWWVWHSLWNDGNPVLPLVLGLGSLAGTGWALVVFLKRLRADPPQFTVTPDEVRPGDVVTALYRQRFRRSAIVTEAVVRLVREEEAVKGSGKHRTTHTDRVVVQEAKRSDLAFGPDDELVLSLNARIPVDAMHSFDFGDNELNWKVEAAVSIRGWPDESDYEFIEVRAEPPA